MSQSKKQIAAAAKKTTDALGEHVKGLTDHTLDVALYNNHGHAMGRQGPKGHPLPPSHAHLQGGGFIPRGVLMSDSGEASQGGFQQSGAAGADYSTTSVGDTGDPDSGGPTGY
jgi:hypothetical protein